MSHLYEQYKSLQLDCSCLGLERGPSQSEYFCTPVGAEVIAWTGVDGVHYCFVPGFDETVFVVGPMNGIGDYVYPVAETFTDFLRLVLACGGEAAITEAYDWTQTVFDAFLEENQPTAEQTAVLAQLRDAFDLTPMEEPFAYIKAVQANFDYSQIPYSEEYRELTGDCTAASAESASAAASCWKVSYAGGFWSNEGDAVRRKQDASAQGMIGGSVGVIGMVRSDSDTEPMQHPDGSAAVPRAVCSALHFEPVQEVTWQLVFRKKTHEDLTISLI